MKNRCVFVKEAGRRIDSESVAWYDVSLSSLIDDYFNTGDMTVYDSTLKLLDYRMSCRVNIDVPVDYVVAARIRETYEFIVLRASNYIHESMDWGYFSDWLEALQLPVLCLGVGAQAVTEREIQLPSAGKRVWQIISERIDSIGVRGQFSASVLNDNGIKNVEIVGCPSIFRSRTPDITLRHKEPQEISNVSFSLRRETGENYTNNADQFLELQKKWIKRLNKKFKLTLTAHGEIEEKIFYYNYAARRQQAKAHLQNIGWFDQTSGGEMERMYEAQLFFTPVVSHYDEFIRTMDAAIGYRVHGVLPALAAGTPSVLLRYDARSAELAETLHIPLLDPEESILQSFSKIFDREQFYRFELNYPIAYMKMKAFLDKNEIANKM